MNTVKNNNYAHMLYAFLLLCVSAFPSTLLAQPSFSKNFIPATIGPGSTSRLTFTIDNPDFSPATQLSFVDILPLGVVVATPANIGSTCSGTTSAPDGGSNITLTDGAVGGGEICTLSVDVTSNVPGTHTNVSGDLTSSAGNSGAASDDLVVDTGRPGFSKAFSPTALPLGARSTLTFTIDNTANASNLFSLSFADNLPDGLVVASPANASTTCASPNNPSPLTAVDGSSSISFSASGVWALATLNSCTVSVDVTATGVGSLVNSSGELSYSTGVGTQSAGKANAVIEVTTDSLSLIKNFVDDPAVPGGTVELQFIIFNRDRDFSATDISFTDNLDATLSGLTALSVDANECGASIDIATDPGFIDVAGGSLAPGESCTISLTLQTPAGAAPGSYPNITSSLTADIDGNPIVSSPGSETLFLANVPLLSKTFLENPVAAGGQVTMEFSITNTDLSAGISNISFNDNLDAFISGHTLTTPLPLAVCGGFLTRIQISGEWHLALSGGSLPAGGACSFQVGVQLPSSTPGGAHVNTTTSITAEGGDGPVVGKGASATLIVFPAPRLSKSFTDDPVLPGDMVTLEFTISHDLFAPGDASNIGFSDDLSAVLPGLTVAGPVSNGCGGVFSGTTLVSLAGAGPLAPGSSCTISIPLSVPAAASPGLYLNTSSVLTADVTDGVDTVSVVGLAAQDGLLISGLTLSKRFVDDPVIPGRSVTLSFTIDNTSASQDATDIFFTDNIASVLSGLSVIAPSLPQSFCGGTLSGTTTLVFSGGTVAAGEQCSFDVTLQVPVAAASGEYTNSTSSLQAIIAGEPVILQSAFDILNVEKEVLFIAKNFQDDPVMPGAATGLEFELSNLSQSETVQDITFTDDLDAALSGLVAMGLPQSDVCGAGSQISGTSTLSLSGGVLGPGETCTFTVPLQIPAVVSSGTLVINTTSSVSGMTADSLGVNGNFATDSLSVQNVAFSKSFATPVAAGGSTILTFRLTNLSLSQDVTGLAFIDDLNSMIAGASATNLPSPGFCGPGSMINGASVVAITGASLASGETCEFAITVSVPLTTVPATYVNETGSLTTNGLVIAVPATDSLTVPPPPVFSKNFSPDQILVNEKSTLTFTISNSASVLSANNLNFTDNLPAGLLVATPSNASTTCSGGMLTAESGAGVITYNGGSLVAGGSCTISVQVSANAGGVYNNVSGDLISNLGVSGVASDSLLVISPPVFTKLFSPDTVSAGEVSTLTFTVDNSFNSVVASDLSFFDNLPLGLSIATPANATTNCSGGTLSAEPSDSTIGYSGGSLAAGGICTLSVDVASSDSGVHANTTEALTSSLGNSGTASATLTVNPVPDFNKQFIPSVVAPGGITRLVFTIDNSSSTQDANNLSFTDNMPDGMLVASNPAAGTTCTGGSLVAGTGGQTISYTGGSVPANTTCTVFVNVTATEFGSYDNVTSDLTSNRGASSPASAILQVGVVSVPFINSWGLFVLMVLLGMAGAYYHRREGLRRPH